MAEGGSSVPGLKARQALQAQQDELDTLEDRCEALRAEVADLQAQKALLSPAPTVNNG